MKSDATKSLEPVYAEMCCLWFPWLNYFRDHNPGFLRFAVFFSNRRFQPHPIWIKTQIEQIRQKYVCKFDCAFFLNGSCVSYCEYAKENLYFRQYWVVHNTKYVRNSNNFKPWKIPDLRLKQTGINEKNDAQNLTFSCMSEKRKI